MGLFSASSHNGSRFSVNASSINLLYRREHGKRPEMTSFRMGEQGDGECCDCTSDTCGQVLLTGCMGCKWRERGKKSSSKCDMFWFIFLVITFLLSLVWLHYGVATFNIAFEIDCFLNKYLLDYSQWIYWYIIGMGITALFVTYLSIMLIMSLLHACMHVPIYISHFHRLLLLFCLAAMSAGAAGLYLLDNNSPSLLLLLLEFNAPFLHIGAVLIMTVVTYLIAGKWLRLNSFGWQTATMIVYVVIMLSLYLCPLVIPASLVVQRADVPPRPVLIAHRGASTLMPENTIAAMTRAERLDIHGVSMDVWLSYDGVPFLHRDNTMGRTTDVGRLFPEKVQEITTPYWNSSQLMTLNAGNWFLEADPFMIKPTFIERAVINKQKIPFLTQALDSLDNDTNVLVTIHEPGANFKNKVQYLEKILAALNASDTENEKISVVDDIKNPRVDRAYQFSRLSPGVADAEALADANYTGVFVSTSHVDRHRTRELQNLGMLTTVEKINSAWLYSMMWVRGVQKVVTKYPQNLAKQQAPSYTIEPTSYLIIWTTIDGVSILGVLLMWGVQIHYSRKNTKSKDIEQRIRTRTRDNIYIIDHSNDRHSDLSNFSNFAPRRQSLSFPPSNVMLFRQPSLTRVDFVLKPANDGWGIDMPKINEQTGTFDVQSVSDGYSEIQEHEYTYIEPDFRR